MAKTIIYRFSFILAIFGFLGNVILCITFSCRKITHKSINTLVVNLSVADTLQCINIVFIITDINDITWYKTDTWCQLNGVTSHTFVGL